MADKACRHDSIMSKPGFKVHMCVRRRGFGPHSAKRGAGFDRYSDYPQMQPCIDWEIMKSSFKG